MNAARPMSKFPPVTDVLPHRGTMLLIDSITAYSDTAATCAYRPRANAWYADGDGAMPAWLGIEIMAQAVAVHVGLTALRQGKAPKMGALLGSRNYHCARPAFAAGEALVVTTQMQFRDDSGLGAYDCSIVTDGREIASATLKVYEPENFDQFLATGNPAQ